MFDVFIRKSTGEAHNYRNVHTMSFSGARILFTFKDGSIVRVSPGEVEEIKILSNVRRVRSWD